MNTKRYSEEDFNEFLHELIKMKPFNDSKEEGIVKLVIDQGFESLSEKQKFVFEKAIKPFVYDDCVRCGADIPWSEMLSAEDNGQQCSYCAQAGR